VKKTPHSPEFDRFTDAVRPILNVSKAEMQTRIDARRKTGKRLSKGSASLAPAVRAKLRSAISDR
jgi:hypothetical protein